MYLASLASCKTAKTMRVCKWMWIRFELYEIRGDQTPIDDEIIESNSQ